MRPGDVLCVYGTSVEDRLISLAQRHRDPQTYGVTHVALIASPTGSLIESTGQGGVQRGNVSKYAHLKTQVLPIKASPAQRGLAVQFATKQLGQTYGWLDLVSIGLGLVTGGRLIFRADRSWICSQLVSAALQESGAYEFDRDPSQISPGDLAAILTQGTIHAAH